jgi:hypothetical protein
VISYCVAVYRPVYARLLLADLVRKTSTPFEILIWLNVADPEFESFVAAETAQGRPITVVGRTPENIGMRAYPDLFRAARYPLVVQIDDDVVCVSRRIAETAADVFRRYSDVRQIVSDVWQDEHTTGARPPLSHYRCIDERDGLYAGPIDGWFSIYHRTILPVVLSIPAAPYYCLGAAVRMNLARRRQRGVLCRRMKVFHTIGPAYAALFGMLDFEIAKYRRLGRTDIVRWYEEAPPPLLDDLRARFEQVASLLDGEGTW